MSCYTQLLIACDIGQTTLDAVISNSMLFFSHVRFKVSFIRLQNNSILNAINQFPFYLLPLKQQKMFKLLLNRTQNGVTFQMGPFSELNYEATTKVRKAFVLFICSIC